MVIKDDVILGKGVKIWQPGLCNLYGCIIGDDTSIGAFCEIRKGVTIGHGCKLQAFIFIPEGVYIGNEVFIGPHVCFTNDMYPRVIGDWQEMETHVKDYVSIGAGTTICPGVTIGKNAMVGAGSVVTKDIPNNELWVGNPARFLRKLV